jgi:endonuclease YncB( thermonuclease family)
MGGCGRRPFGLFFKGLCIAGAAALACGPVWAQAGPPGATACKGVVIGSGTVVTVIDGRSFALDDGREIRLVGIEVPLPPLPGEGGPAATAGNSARAALESIIAGRQLELRQPAVTPAGRSGRAPPPAGAAGEPATDRYGRVLAFAFVGRNGASISVAHELLAQGFARVGVDAGERACVAELLGRERAARQAGLGLWGTTDYAVTGAENFDELVAGRGRFTVAEGKVLSVRESGGTIYMNFGRRWSQALTVTVLKKNERTFASAGLDLRRLENRRLRVRGWLEERSGPRIEATRPEQIEIAERN